MVSCGLVSLLILTLRVYDYDYLYAVLLATLILSVLCNCACFFCTGIPKCSYQLPPSCMSSSRVPHGVLWPYLLLHIHLTSSTAALPPPPPCHPVIVCIKSITRPVSNSGSIDQTFFSSSSNPIERVVCPLPGT